MELTRDEQKAFDRYQQIVALLTEIKDERGLRLVRELVEKCRAYIQVVTQTETHIKILEMRDVSPEDYRASVSNMERNRNMAHNALMSQLIIANRYLFNKKELEGKIPAGGLFSLNTESIRNREAVADWAHYLIRALILNGIITTR